MKKIINILLLSTLPLVAFASSGGIALQEADTDLTDNDSLLRGAKYYATYCQSCHSLKHIRYQRMAVDFEFSDEKVLTEVAPEGAGIYDKMLTAMNPNDAKKWFGTTPPDLSLIARSRGTDWLYSYLKGFYADPTKPLGINNTVFPDVGMPNVLWKLQGTQVPVFEDDNGTQVIEKLTLEQQGELSEQEFDQLVIDLVNFLDYAGEPIQLERKSTGKYVLFFILMFTVLAYFLKKEYWKDVH